MSNGGTFFVWGFWEGASNWGVFIPCFSERVVFQSLLFGPGWGFSRHCAPHILTRNHLCLNMLRGIGELDLVMQWGGAGTYMYVFLVVCSSDVASHGFVRR